MVSMVATFCQSASVTVEGCQVSHCGTFSSVSSLDSLHLGIIFHPAIVTGKHKFRYCQMLPGATNISNPETLILFVHSLIGNFTQVYYVFRSYLMTGLARYTHWCNSAMNTMGVPNSYLIGLKDFSTELSAWCFKTGRNIVLSLLSQLPHFWNCLPCAWLLMCWETHCLTKYSLQSYAFSLEQIRGCWVLGAGSSFQYKVLGIR